ncbi:MAG: hypothetical protein P8O81_03755 [Flavobacteriaceae bacterium]|nr:hypothetical protein [Flavobacteriaceae bacterium]
MLNRISSDKMSKQINYSRNWYLASKQIFISLIPSTINSLEIFLFFDFDNSFLILLNATLFLLSIYFKIIL